MKNRYISILFTAFIFTGCINKKLHLDNFEMDIPAGWNYEPGDGTDPITGTITTPNSKLTFEYSAGGAANSLVPTEQQYLARQDNWASSACYFCKPGVSYVPAQDIKAEKLRLQRTGVKDTSLIKVEPTIQYTKSINVPNNKWKRYYPGANYIANLKYKDSTIYVPIYIPNSIKIQNIQIDSTSTFIIKTIWPQIPGRGITGVYFKSRITAQNFNMQGTDLSADEQEKALKAFKTIKFKQ